jgi:hypothetical protein
MLAEGDTNLQGRVRHMRGRVLYSDDGTDLSMTALPAGTLVYAMLVRVVTTFDDSGTDLLKVGTSVDDDAYAKTVDVDLTTAGLTAAFTGASAFPQVLTAATTILMRYDGQNSDATQGELHVDILYVPSRL